MGKGGYYGGNSVGYFADLKIGLPDLDFAETKSKYSLEISEMEFFRYLPANLSRRRLDLLEMVDTDASKQSELETVNLWLSDMEKYKAEAAEYVRGFANATRP